MWLVHLDSGISTCPCFPALLEFFGKVEVILSAVEKKMNVFACMYCSRILKAANEVACLKVVGTFSLF